MKHPVGAMFDEIDRLDRDVKYGEWRAPEPPCLTEIQDIIIDFETNGLKWWAGNKPVGVAYCLPDGTTGYLPWGHYGGGNLPFERVQDWLKDLKNKQITNAGTRFEVHMAQTIDVDLEEQGNQVSDIQHWAALLDDHRRRFSLEVLCEDYLPTERKVLTVGGEKLDGAKFAEYPAGMVAVRAEADCRQVFELMKVMQPQLEAQDLMRVKQLEDDVIYASCEMERNALPMDVQLLRAWHTEAEQRYLRYLWQIHRDTGIHFNPGSAKSWGELFKKLGISWTDYTATGMPQVTDALIKKIDHPTIKIARKAGKLADLKSDYLDKYYNTVDPDEGLLRFALHQLRSDEGGTISGRYSAAAIKIGSEKIGCNPQQVPDINKQIEKGHDPEFIIRKLFIPGAGRFISADAKQIEYRLFADYAKNPRVLKAYEDDPDMSFHRLIHSMLLPFVPTLSYEQQKNVNFMKIYAGGLTKLALMLEFITDAQAGELRRHYAPKAPSRDDPLLKEAANIDDIYARELPEVKPLMDRAVHIAKVGCDQWCRAGDELHRKFKHQGFVRDLLGRRIRFPDGNRLHKSLNGIIQGGAASILKRKMVEAHRARKRIGFVPRMTNHDELIGDSLGEETPRLLGEVLNQQSFPQLTVQIRWDVKVGANWAEC